MLTKERWDVMSFAETFKALSDPVRREILMLLKKGTLSAGEIHDLDRETPDCHIDEINPEHIFSCDTYTEAVLFASMLAVTRNGCPHCMPERNRH